MGLRRAQRSSLYQHHLTAPSLSVRHRVVLQLQEIRFCGQFLLCDCSWHDLRSGWGLVMLLTAQGADKQIRQLVGPLLSSAIEAAFCSSSRRRLLDSCRLPGILLYDAVLFKH